MNLYQFHRVLIVAAILFSAGYGLFCFHLGGTANTILGIAVGGIAVALVAYLIYFNRKMKALSKRP